MDCSQDLFGLDNENNRTNFLRESDPFPPLIPFQEIKSLEGLNTPPVTPQHSPQAFLKEDRWLFSPPPVLTVAPTKFEVKLTPNILDNSGTEFSSTPCDTEM